MTLQPSMGVFKDMVHQLKIGKENTDGADQGFICGYFPDLLDRPMFHPPPNGTRLAGNFRLPLGYQMDASYYCEYEDSSPLITRLLFLGFVAILTYFFGCRSEAPLEHTLWTEQRDHIPQRTVVQALVLVVMARPATRDIVA